jgi:Tol biopolymer transport system component
VVPDGQASAEPLGLTLLAVSTGEKRPLTRPLREYDVDAAFAPDMTRLVFTRHSSQTSSDLYLLELSNNLALRGEPVQLEFRHRQAVSPAWTSDGKSILFARYPANGSPSLWRMRLSGGQRNEPLPVATESALGLAISSKTNRLIYTHSIENETIWGLEAFGSPLWQNRKRAARPWISSSSRDSTADFSPDGRQIAFQSVRSGYAEVWVANRDGSQPRQLTDLKGTIAGFPRWSPDARKIVFHSRQPSEAVLYVVDVVDGRTHHLDAGSVRENALPSWSHDGKWIYFSSRWSGNAQI